MDKARSSLRKEYDALTSLAENGLTEQDRQTLREDYAVDIPAMRKEAEKKVDAMAAATLSKKAMAAADGIADQAYDKQIARFNALKPEDAESLLDYEYQLEKITGSILYIKSAQNLARGKSTGPEAEDSIERYGKRMSGILKTPDGITKSAGTFARQFVTHFHAFKEPFKKLFLEAKEKGPVTKERIFEIADEALGDAYKGKPKAEDPRSLDILSASIGSRVNSKTFGMDREVNNDAPQAAPEADKRKDEAEAEAGSGLGPA